MNNVRRAVIVSIFLITVALVPAYSVTFFELIYSPTVTNIDDREDNDDFLNLLDSSSMGGLLGYSTEISSSKFYFDLEFGYEFSDHQLLRFEDNTNYLYRSHRGFMGVRFKSGHLVYVEPYIGGGVMAYSYLEMTDALENEPFDAQGRDYHNYEIEKWFSGTYYVVGIDFFFSQKRNFSIGAEYRKFDFTLINKDIESDVLNSTVERTAFKLSILL